MTAPPGRHRRTRPTRRRGTIVALLVVLGVVVVTPRAAALWTTSGNGSGNAGTGNAAALTVSPGSPSTAIYPGGTATVALVLRNPNAGSVPVGSLSLDTTQGTSGFAVDVGHSGCDTAALSFTTQTNGGSGWTVPGGSPGTLSLSLSGALSMASTAADACQGASFSVYLKAQP